MSSTKYSPLPLATRPSLAKRERGLLLDVGHLPYGTTAIPSENGSAKPAEPSPRVLPPAWLMGNNLKITSHGKTTQIGKKGITDWKSVSQSQGATATTTTNTNATGVAAAAITNAHVGSTVTGESSHQISLPSCPGALSPTKNLKKKLTPMPNVNFSGTLESNYFATPVSSFLLLLN